MPSPDEAPAVLDYFSRNRSHLERWEPKRPDDFYTESFWRRRLDLNREHYEAGQSMRLFLARKEAPLGTPDRLIGTINFSDVIRGPFQACYLGYGIDGTLQRQGLMREALDHALDAAFDRLGLHRIMANYQPTNEPSGRLLRRLGFSIEGYARDYLFINGAWRDHILTSLLRPARRSASPGDLPRRES